MKKRLDAEGYDTLSEYLRDKIFNENLSQAPVIFEFDDVNIIAAIEKNRSILVQVLHNQERAQQLQPIKNIIDSLMSLVSLEDMQKCRTIDDLRSLFPLDSQKAYVYDLVNYLEKLKLVISKEIKGVEKLFWLED